MDILLKYIFLKCPRMYKYDIRYYILNVNFPDKNSLLNIILEQ